MFSILIVEDDSDKLKYITQVLEEIEGIHVDSVEHVVDSLSAKQKLSKNYYDLLILDIAIPLRKSEDIDPEGGIKLLQELLTRSVYKQPTHVIGLTSHDDIYLKAQAEFKSQVLSVIRYSLVDVEWKTQLRKGVEMRVTSKASITSKTPTYDYDIAIITAIEKEFVAVKELVQTWHKIRIENDMSPYFETIFERGGKTFRVVATCAKQMGMVASAVLTMKLIHNFRPRYIFMSGIAASIKDNTSHGFGDVIIFDECWDGGAGKITQNEKGDNVFLPTAQHMRLDPDISEKIRSVKDDVVTLRAIKDAWKQSLVPNTELSVHIGAMTSVAGVVENKAVVDELKQKDRKLLGLELEAYGMYYAAANCSNPKPVPIALKAVSDFANTDKNDLYQHYAAYTSARVMMEFIMTEL